MCHTTSSFEYSVNWSLTHPNNISLNPQLLILSVGRTQLALFLLEREKTSVECFHRMFYACFSLFFHHEARRLSRHVQLSKRNATDM